MRLIDADELDRAFSKARWYPDGGMHHWGDRPNWCLHGSEVDRLIKEAPTIEAEPVRRGKWVLDGKYNRHCSLCNENVVWSFNYCPRCGAKMEV